MDLNEIETKAEELAERLLAAGKGEALLLGVQIEGLKDLAVLKATADARAQHNVAVDMRQRELAAMERAAQAASMAVVQRAQESSTAVCGQRWSWIGDAGARHYETCTLPDTHLGYHFNGVTRVSAVNAVPEAKPAAERLQELVRYLVQQAGQAYNAAQVEPQEKESRYIAVSKAYDDAATRLQEILREGTS